MPPTGGDVPDLVEVRAAEVVLGRTLARGRLRGRLIPSDSGGLLLLDATGRCRLHGVDPALAWAWVELIGTAEAGAFTFDAVAIVRPPRAPMEGADLAHLAWRDGRRAGYLVARARARAAVRAYFDARGFLEVETPAMVPNPGSDLHLDAFAVHGAPSPRFLSTSPELQMKRLVSAGLDRVYQLRYAYRRDEHGTHHEPEFTMLEWYRAFADRDALIDETEALVVHVARALGHGRDVRFRGADLDLTRPWPRKTIREVYRAHVDPEVDAFGLDDETFFRLFAERVQPALGHGRPVHVIDWPARFASLARLSPNDPEVADRVETFLGGIELSNGFVELDDPVEQAARFDDDARQRAAEGKVVYPHDTRFLDALRDGFPETVGNALGFDRLVMILTDAPSIADVIAIPSARV